MSSRVLSSLLDAPDLSSGVFTDTASPGAAVCVRGLSKSYSIARNAVQHSTMGEALIHRLRRPFEAAQRETFWALNDVSFDIQKGDVVGIIGRNGAGKSTLLKILSRITEPTKGRIDLYGRVGSLLEVGTGFHPELTGRENIYLNGAILGMQKREIARQFDAIVDFSGTSQFLDTPVKRYSSGMYVRLAFAVAAHLNPEILIVDEVLAVGDAEFQKKCLGKMQDVAESGRTVLFVSHNMQSIALLCNKGLFMQNGRIAYSGAVETAIGYYLASFLSPAAEIGEVVEEVERRPGSGEYRFTLVEPTKSFFEGNDNKTFQFRVKRTTRALPQLWLSAHVFNASGIEVAQFDSRLMGQWFQDAAVIEGLFQFTSPWLKPGSYRMDFYVCATGVGVVDKFEGACTLNISPVIPYPCSCSEDGVDRGIVFAEFSWQDKTSNTQLIDFNNN